ncbi:MAG: hypothetical protein J7L23_03260 [Candidatus Diapherotrites archaeon]|nr:hypothetical protein [Candidatus Diapherotrites archaeon]
MVSFKSGQRGQESAPFNLIIAGVMITFTIVVLGHLLVNSNTTFCVEKMQSNAQSLAREIEKTAQYSRNNTELTVNLNFPSCGDIQIDNFTIKDSDPIHCVKYCHASSCMLMTINGYTGGSATTVTEPICIKVPTNTTINTTGCQSLFGAGYKDIPDRAFKPKVYQLSLIKTISGETTIHICDVG